MPQLEPFDIDHWARIARGNGQLPGEFQQMMASWELVDAWRRFRVERTQCNEATFISQHFLAAVTQLSPGDDSEWNLLTNALLLECPVEVMIGGYRTGERRTFAGPTDFKGILDVLYTIRCNFVHAGKDPANSRDVRLTGKAAPVATYLALKLIRQDSS